MDLSIYEIIKGPWVTSKAYRLNARKELVLEVHMHANKPMIAEALKKLFNADIATIRTLIVKGKQKQNRRRDVFMSKTRKKAIVALKPGSQELSQLSVPVVTYGSQENAETK